MHDMNFNIGAKAGIFLQATSIQGTPVAEDKLNGDDSLPITINTTPINGKSIPNEHCPQHQFPSCPIPSYILKIPPRKAAAPATEPAPTPAESAVSLEFLRAFLRRIPGGANGGATMARVVEELIRPSTSATLSSYASQPFLVPRSHISTPTWVVIYPWDMPVADMVAALEDFTAGIPPTQTYFWLRALAVSQHLMGASAALQPMEDTEEEPAPGEEPAPAGPADGGGQQQQQQVEAGAGAGAGDARGIAPTQSFGTMLRKRQVAMATRQKVAVRAARLDAVAATRGAVAASRCGALLLVGRDVRPLRRGWCLVELAEVLRSKGPEAVTVLPVDTSFTRADLVRQLRELDVADAVAEAEEYDKEVLAEVLGVRLPQPPVPVPADVDPNKTPGGPTPAAGGTGAPATGAGASSAANSTASSTAARQRPSATNRHPPHSQSPSQTRSSGPNRRSNRPSGSGSGSGSGVAVGSDPGEDDGFSGGRALVRQLQLVLLLRPMDGALPARMMGSTLGDAKPVATNSIAASSGAGPTAFATPAAANAAAAAMSQGSKGTISVAAPSFPCGFDWLWNWTPLTSWLALPPEHPSWQALLITGTHGSGKTTAMAALLSRLSATAAATSSVTSSSSLAAAPMVACHFCSAADTRSLVATEVVRSLAYQLSCRCPGFGAAICRSLLQLGGAGGGLALTPDGWLQGLDDTVAVLLRKPMEQDAEARAARGAPPATYLLLIDGLDEGPASAASSSVLVDTYTPEDDIGPPACPGPYQVLRLLVDHLRHLPGVRLILSCTQVAEAAADVAPGSRGGDGACNGSTAPTTAALPSKRPFEVPPSVVVAPRIAADASTSVHLAVRQALRPGELSLTSLRRDKHLPLALAHVLQEYVLSPELTARELLWQARGCLAHVHILQLLVKYAAEQLAPAAGLPDGTAIAAVATAANAAVGAAAHSTGGPPDERTPTDAMASPVELQPQPQPQNVGHPPAQQQQQLQPQQRRGHDMPQRPRTPPRQDQAGLVRQQIQRRPSGTLAPLEAATEKGIGPEIAEPASALVSGDAQITGMLPSAAPPTELAVLNAPNTGDGFMGVHVLPPISRGSLADEYGVLWQVRTVELQEAAMVALARGMEPSPVEEPPPSPQQNRKSPRRMDTMTLGLTAVHPPLPPYPPERAARLQVLVDVLAAAQEPLEWPLLARAVLAAEPVGGPVVAVPFVAPSAAPAAGTSAMPVRTARAELRSPSPAAGDAVTAAAAVPPGSPAGARNMMPRRGSIPLSVHSVAGDGGLDGNGARSSESQQSRPSSRADIDEGSRSPSPFMNMPRYPWAGRETAAAAAASALRDLEWALQEGPLAGLVWISGCGRVTVRHSSFLDWLRRASTAVSAAATSTAGPPTTAAAAMVAAAAAVSASSETAAAAAVVEPPLRVPCAQRGHTILARLLRQQLLSGRLAAAEATAPGTPLGTAAAGLRRPGSASSTLRIALEAAGSAALVALGLVRPSQVSSGQLLGLGSSDGGGGGASRRSFGPPAPLYCLRHIVTHCAEGRLPTSELETTILDLDFWRQVLEGCHLEMVAATLEHLLRTRGPHARRLLTPQQLQHQQQQGLLQPGMLPRTPQPAGGAAAVVRSAPVVATSPQGSGSVGDAITTTTAATAVVGPIRDGRTAAPPPLSAATSSLLRDTLLWLSQDARSLMRRPEPQMLACSASCTSLQSPFRRLAEQITAMSAAVATAAAADALFPSPSKSHLGGHGAINPMLQGTTGPLSPVAVEPLFPPSFVTAMPHPRFRLPIMRAAECPHRVTGLLASPDGELVLASGECALKASIMDTLTGRRALLLHAGRGAHHSALSAAAFAPSRALLATAGYFPGVVTLWDLTTGAPRASLQLQIPPRDGVGEAPCEGKNRGSVRSNTIITAEPSFAMSAVNAAATASTREATATATDDNPIASGPFTVPSAVPPLALPSLGSASVTSAPLSTAISSVHVKALSPRTEDPSSRLFVSIAGPGEWGERGDPSGVLGDPQYPSTRLTSATHGPQATTAFGNDEPYVTCVAICEPGPAASATAYGAPLGARMVASSADAADAEAAGAGVSIVRGSALVAAGSSSSGRVVLWAVAPDGWRATRTAELVPPAGFSLLHVDGSGVAWLGFLSGGKSLMVVQSCSTTLRVWNVQSHNITATLRLPAACGEVFGIHISPQLSTDTVTGGSTSETFVAAVCTSSTELWALGTRKPVASLPFGAGGEGGGRSWAVSCVAFSPAGGLLATAGALYAKLASSAGIYGRGRADTLAAETGVQQPQDLASDSCAATLWDARSGAQVMQLRGMRSAVRALAFSPDGALLATAVTDATAMLWSAATGACLSVLPLAEDVMDVPAVVFARRGAVLMAAGGSAVYTWDVQLAVASAVADAAIGAGSAAGFTGGTTASRNRTHFTGGGGSRRAMNNCLDVSGHRDRVGAVCFSPNGALALTGGDDSTIRLWDVVRHTELVVVEQPGAVLGIAWSPDGTLIAAGLSNGTAYVWYFGAVAAVGAGSGAGAAAAAAAAGDFTTREAARLRCRGGGNDAADEVSTTMNAVSFTGDGKLLLTADGEGRVSIWSVNDWQQVGTAVPSVRPSRAAVSRGAASTEGDGSSGSSGAFGSGTLVGRYAGAAFSADGRWLLMGCGREVMLWSIKSKRESSDRLGPHGAPVVAVAASPCGKLAAVGAGSTVTIWGRPGAAAAAGSGATAGGSGTGRASGSVSFRANPTEGGAGGPSPPFSARVTLLPALAEVTGLAFSADSTMLAASLGDGSVRVWDTGRWKEVGWLSAHGAAATCVAFNPDGLVLLSGGADNRCLSWSTRDVLQPVFGSVTEVLEGKGAHKGK